MEIPGYTIVRLIGQGGMATAYLAEQASLERLVVLKVLSPGEMVKKDAVERFLNEGRIVASLNHPNIITIFDIARRDDLVYIAMEYVQAGDLRQRIEARRYQPPDALKVVKCIARGLRAAHERGIVHRDVKPGNVLFRDNETPLLSDFGIAKQLTVDANLTTTGIFLGSPNYMAPEQAEAGPVDGRADIYSLGCIFFEMLTQQKLFVGETVIDIIHKHKKAPIPKLPRGQEAYQELLSRMVAKSRTDRFRDMAALLHYIDQLEEALAEGAQAAQAVVEAPAAMPGATRLTLDDAPSRGSRRTLALGVAMMLSAMLFFGLGIAERRVNQLPLAMPVPAPAPTASAPTAAPVAGASAPSDDEVRRALLWLARHSLDQNRLTAPPGDNAYYYYSRLAQHEPGSAEAARGLRDIADRFALLAERALAEGRAEEARRYISAGLAVDPTDPALATLQPLAAAARPGPLAWLRRQFR